MFRENYGMKNASVRKFRYEKCSILQGTFTKKKLIGAVNLLNEKNFKKKTTLCPKMLLTV